MLKPASILLVDDEPEIIESLRDILEPLGYTVHCATDPRTALQKASQQQIDIVIADINMPEMDGIQLLRNLKTMRPLVQVIMVTAFSTLEKIQACLEAGASDYLLKPLADMEETLTIIQEADQRVRRWRRNFMATMQKTKED